MLVIVYYPTLIIVKCVGRVFWCVDNRSPLTLAVDLDPNNSSVLRCFLLGLVCVFIHILNPNSKSGTYGLHMDWIVSLNVNRSALF